jgi:hypothetical protein
METYSRIGLSGMPAKWEEVIRAAFDEKEKILPLQNVEMFKIRKKVLSSPLVSSVLSHLLHSFRVCFPIFFTRFECSFRSMLLPLKLKLSGMNSFRSVHSLGM